MDFTTLVAILIICDQFMATTQSAESGDDPNYPRMLRSEEAYIRRKQKSAKDKRVRISQDEEMRERGSLVGESSSARRSHTGMARIERNPEGETKGTSRKVWTNEEYDTLLRLAYAHYDRTAHNGVGAVDWKTVVISWYGQWNLQIRDLIKYKFGNLQKRMQETVKKFDNGGTRWSRRLNDDLLKIYFATEAGDEQKHAERIYADWVEVHPEYYRMTPAYLLERAETMLSSVMKFSLDNPRGKIKPRQLVMWKPEHNRLLQYLWHQPHNNITLRKQQLFDEAVKHCPAMRYLDEDRIYEHAKWLNSQSVKSHEKTTIIQRAKIGRGRNYSHIPRFDEAEIRRRQMSAKDKRVMSNQDEETSGSGRLVEESSEARRKRTGKTIIEHDLEGETSKYKRKVWTNEEHGALIRLAYAHYDKGALNRMGAVDWKHVATALYGYSDLQLTDKLRFKFNSLQRKMRNAVEHLDNGGIKWSKELDMELLRIYLATETGDKSEHAEKIHAAWLKEYPEFHGLKPNYLFERAETMFYSVMKFSLDDPRGKIRLRQLVDWKPEHEKLLRSLWYKIPRNVTSRKQYIYNEAIKHCSVMQHLEEDRVYEHAKWLSSQPAKIKEQINLNEGSLPNTTHVKYHSFMDEENFRPLGLGTHSDHGEKANTSSQPGPSHSRPEPNLDLNIFHSERESPDTNLYLGYQSHD